MGKRKPKLCRMNRLMFPKNHIFLFTERKQVFVPSPSHSTIYFTIYDHPFVISHFANYIIHDIMCKYTYNKITHQ